MYQQSVSPYSSEYDEGLRKFMLSVFNNMAVGLAVEVSLVLKKLHFL